MDMATRIRANPYMPNYTYASEWLVLAGKNLYTRDLMEISDYYDSRFKITTYRE